VQLPYLGKSQNTKNGKFRRKQHNSFVNKQRSATRLIAGSICWDSKTSQ